jgi:SAM-dependent methyltransferase
VRVVVDMGLTVAHVLRVVNVTVPSVRNPQTNYPTDLADMAAWVRSFTPPGGRVLEIGCSDGALVDLLASAGIDIVGVDPNADPGERVLVEPFEQFESEPFDVVFSSVSLHHLHDPVVASAALVRLTKPGSVLLVREFDRDLMLDEPTVRWWFHQRHAKDAVEPDGKHPLSTDFAEYVAGQQAHMAHHVHPWPVVEAMMLDAGFTRETCEPMPYLFRWGLSEDVRPIEERLVAAGAIKQVGIRWMGRRT